MDFLKRPEFEFLKAIHKANAEIYLVGGNVRDHLLKRTHKDHDFLIRKIGLDELTEVLRPYGWVNHVGKSFGVLKFRPRKFPDVEFDLSFPRVEKSTGKGHKDFEVNFNPELSVETDLGRRDFTINAMAIDIQSKKHIDPFGGQKDLKNKLIRQVFREAFEEDPLRLLRAVQFAARLRFDIEEETWKSMKKHSELIKTVSPERISEEIKKLFLAVKPSRGFDIMRDTGILPHIFPYVEKMIGVIQPMKRNEDVYEHTMKVLDASRSASELEKPGDLDIMFAALLHDAGKPQTVGYDKEKERTTFYGHQNVSRKIARRWLNTYRASAVGVNIPKVLNLVQNHMFETKAFYSDRAIRRFVSKVGKDHIYDLVDLRIADKKGGKFPQAMKGIINLRERIREELSKKPPFGPKDLAITGHDLMNMGFKEGPLFGKIQRFLIEKVLDEPELNTSETLTKIVEENFEKKT